MSPEDNGPVSNIATKKTGSGKGAKAQRDFRRLAIAQRLGAFAPLREIPSFYGYSLKLQNSSLPAGEYRLDEK